MPSLAVFSSIGILLGPERLRTACPQVSDEGNHHLLKVL